MEQREMITDIDEWNAIIIDARQEVGRIYRSGGMATKTRVEDYLMPKYNINRYCAHDIMNYIQQHNLKML